jgi:predicted TIM-barrel fold metal-dependent hydrolase
MQTTKVDGVRFKVPAWACDCHMHVFGPLDKYPPASARSYTPIEASLSAWRDAIGVFGMRRTVVVQPSAYGTDNSCLRDALMQLGSLGRGVASIDDTTSDDDLIQLRTNGVVGVRLNPKSVGARDVGALRKLIERTAARVATLGWHVQLYAELELVNELTQTLRALPVPIVLDHMGGALAPFDATMMLPLLSLLAEGNCWIKLSGAYRVSRQTADFSDSTPIARMLVERNADRIVWGSDWPHTAGHLARTSDVPPAIKFRNVDPVNLLDLLADAAGDEEVFGRILQDNPEGLYGFPKV